MSLPFLGCPFHFQDVLSTFRMSLPFSGCPFRVQDVLTMFSLSRLHSLVLVAFHLTAALCFLPGLYVFFLLGSSFCCFVCFYSRNSIVLSISCCHETGKIFVKNRDLFHIYFLKCMCIIDFQCGPTQTVQNVCAKSVLWGSLGSVLNTAFPPKGGCQTVPRSEHDKSQIKRCTPVRYN